MFGVLVTWYESAGENYVPIVPHVYIERKRSVSKTVVSTPIRLLSPENSKLSSLENITLNRPESNSTNVTTPSPTVTFSEQPKSALVRKKTRIAS